jgi:hypothetical protein
MQTLNGDSKLLRVFIGEMDKYDHSPLYEAILFKAKENEMAGCTVIRGVLSYGASSIVHTSKLIDISEDLPIIVEIIDTDEKIISFAKLVGEMMEASDCGGIVTIEHASVIHYKSRK